MGKSYRKTPIVGNASDSEKMDKRKANRQLRKAVKDMLYKSRLLQEEILIDVMERLPKLREVSNVWDFEKDGKHYFAPDFSTEEEEKEFRKAIRK